MHQRLIVTGAGGFIGRLAAGFASERVETHLLLRDAASGEAIDGAVRSRCQEHYVDLLDPDEVARCIRTIRPTHLLHMAWHGGAAGRWTSEANLDWVAATIALARAFAENGGKRLVVTGSCAEYDWGAERFTEDVTPLKPRTLYGTAKAATHQLLQSEAGDMGLSICWAHVFFCYGPGEQSGRLMSDVICGLLDGTRVECTAGTQTRDYLHTSDIGRALAMLVDSDFEGSMNIGSGSGVTVRELVLAAADIIGHPELIDFGARRMDPGEPDRIVADVARLKKNLNFAPAFTIESGIANTIEWFRQNRHEARA